MKHRMGILGKSSPRSSSPAKRVLVWGLLLLLLAGAWLVHSRHFRPAAAGIVPAETPAAARLESRSAPVVAPVAPPPARSAAVSRREGRSSPAPPAPIASTEPLRQTVAESADRLEIQEAVWQLANRLELSDPDAEVLIRKLEVLTTDPADADLARTVIWALSLRPDRLPVERVAAFAISHPDPRVRRTAVRTLGASSSPWAVAALTRLARQDADAAVRREAVLHLALRVSPDEFTALADQALAAEPDGTLRQSWLHALQLGEGGATAADQADEQGGSWL